MLCRCILYSALWFLTALEAKMASEQHSEKMCSMACCPCNLDVEKLKSLTNNAQYICTSCGRVANDKKNLCKPEPIE